MNELTQRGIAALKAGDRTTARQMLANAVKQDPNDALAWLWLTGAVDSEDERIACLRQVLRIDPGNQAAARGLAQITERRSRQAPVQPASPQPAPPEPPPAAEYVEPKQTDPISRPAQVEAAQPETPAQTAVFPDQPLATETASGLGEPAPVEAEVPAPQPARRKAARAPSGPAARLVFRSRPSLVPALICFWLFLFGAILVGVLLNQAPEIGLPLAGGLGLILEIVVIYTILRNLATRYELTSQQLTLPFHGKRVRIPISDIYNAELTQSFIQRILGIGDIDIDASVNGQLAHLRMRNVSHCHMRAEQIKYLVKEHVSA